MAAGIGAAAAMFAAFEHFHPATENEVKIGILAALTVPLAMLLSAVGLTALGGKLGAFFASHKPGMTAQGALAGLATIGVAALVGALTTVPAFQAALLLSFIELGLGMSLAAAALIQNGGKLDFKNDGLSRLAGKALLSGALSAAVLASFAGWLFFAMAGTMKDKAGAKVSPLYDGVAPLYAQAYAEAMKAAAGKGYKASDIYFSKADAQSPSGATQGWAFQFLARKTPKADKGELINAYLYPQQDGTWRASAYGYGEVEIPAGTALLKLTSSLNRATKADLGDALASAAKTLKVERAALGLSVKPMEEEGSGDKDLWYVFDTEDGRRWGVNGRTGEERAFANSGVTVARIEAAAKSVASYKGMPWSHTEYNMEESLTADSLRRDGAGPAQIRLFSRLCDAAPMRPGGFNPWSGD
ncbi:MAG: hypothetical protein HY077_03555 [Elusimicrobia bacterium]|nr:hypothetical protein [Elusimicrobiota bacterium]